MHEQNNDHTDVFLELPSDEGFQKVVCPPEHFISVAAPDLARALQKNVAPNQHTEFAAFFRLVQATSQFEFMDIRNRLNQDFQPFAAGAAKKPVALAKREEPPTEMFLDQEELEFVNGFDALMEAGFYTRLSKGEWETADREEFTFTMPVEVDWSKNDTELIGRFWEQHPAEQMKAAEISDRILVYHRGIDTATASGLYLMEKIDLLVSYVIAGPIARFLVRQFPQLSENPLMQAIMKVGDGVQESEVQDVPEQLRHKYAKVIYRTSLERQMPDAKTVLSKLVTKLKLSEPQFKSVVVLYREIVEDPGEEPAPAPHSELGLERTGKAPLQEFAERLKRRNIHIKHFEGIPIADTELIFPEKTIFLKPITIIQLAVTLITGLVAAFATLWGHRMSMTVIMSFIVVLGGRASQVYFSANMQRQTMSDAMTKALYEKTRDSQEGVLHRVFEDMTDQHVKESILAYTILLTSATGRALDEDELDEQCEAYLAQRFGQRLDFDISGSLASLLSAGVVWKDSRGLVTAVPLEEAIQKLKRKWAGFFTQTSTVADAGGQATRNTKLARVTLHRSAVQGIPDEQIDKERLRALFEADPSPARRSPNGLDGRPAIEEIGPNTVGRTSNSSHSSPSRRRLTTRLMQSLTGQHGNNQKQIAA